MSNKSKDLADKVEKLEDELESVSKSLTMFHVFIEEGKSLPSKDSLIDMTWGLTQYIDRITDDLSEVGSVLMANKFQGEETKSETE